VRAFLSECLLLEFPASDERLKYSQSLSKMLDLDLNLMCESYMHATLQNLRALNAQLEYANQELAQAGQSKDEFLAHTSHELRTPLNSILGFTKLILDGLCKSPEEERELLRDVYASAQHLLGIVNDILDLGRIEAGKMILHIEEVQPRDVLDSTMPLVTVQAKEKRLEIRDETIRMSLPAVRADEVRLRQVLLNLLSNAVKFTPEGRVTLRGDLASHPGFLRLEVQDTGIGIPRDQREAVFLKFVQVDGKQTRQQGGSGLGLPIARKLVELMGGAIGIEDGAGGQGTRVWFTLPLAVAALGESRSPSSQAVSRQ
jgi:signal transduction histidine kinase